MKIKRVFISAISAAVLSTIAFSTLAASEQAAEANPYFSISPELTLNLPAAPKTNSDFVFTLTNHYKNNIRIAGFDIPDASHYPDYPVVSATNCISGDAFSKIKNIDDIKILKPNDFCTFTLSMKSNTFSKFRGQPTLIIDFFYDGENQKNSSNWAQFPITINDAPTN